MKKNLLVMFVFIINIFFVPTIAQPEPACGGTIRCQSNTIPFSPGTIHTEVNPNWISGSIMGCQPGSGVALGGIVVNTPPIITFTTFTNAPAFDVIAGGTVLSFAMAGDTIMFAGADCKQLGDLTLVNAFAITNTYINVLVGGVVGTYPLPTGSAPVSAAGIAVCTSNIISFTLCAETTAPSIECVNAGVQSSFQIPAPIVTPPVSFTNGQASGVVVFSQGAAYIITGGTFSTITLIGNFMAWAPAVNGINVTTSNGIQNIGIAISLNFVPFGVSPAPFDACDPVAVPSNIAFNIAPCVPNIQAANAGWNGIPGIECSGGGAPGIGGCTKCNPLCPAEQNCHLADTDGDGIADDCHCDKIINPNGCNACDPPCPAGQTCHLWDSDDDGIADDCHCDSIPTLTVYKNPDRSITIIGTGWPSGNNQPLVITDAAGNHLNLQVSIDSSGTFKMNVTASVLGLGTPGPLVVTVGGNMTIEISGTSMNVIVAERIIPTLSQWGLIIFTLLLLAVGMVFVQRRQFAVAVVPTGQDLCYAPTGDGKLFERSLYIKALGVVLLLAVTGLALSYWYFGTLSKTDSFGTLASSGIVAYMVHLWLLMRKK
jgi:hypothetical protein